MTAVLAAVNYETRFLRLMLDHGGDPNAVYDDHRRAALQQALSRGTHTGNWDNLNALITAGADVNRVPASGLPIAEEAIAYGRPSVALLLLEHGYRHDLERLATVLHGRLIEPSSKEFPQRDKVIRLLQELGVDYERIAREVDTRRAAEGMPSLDQH